MPKNRVHVHLSTQLLGDIDTIAEEEYRSNRAAAIRAALEMFRRENLDILIESGQVPQPELAK